MSVIIVPFFALLVKHMFQKLEEIIDPTHVLYVHEEINTQAWPVGPMCVLPSFDRKSSTAKTEWRNIITKKRKKDQSREWNVCAFFVSNRLCIYTPLKTRRP